LSPRVGSSPIVASISFVSAFICFGFAFSGRSMATLIFFIAACFGWLEGFFDFLAVSVEFLLWGGLFLLVVLVVFKYRVWFGQLSGLVQFGSSESVVQPVAVSIIEGESLPDDVVGEVSQFWSDGHFREALGLLYRATLFRCVKRFDVPLYAHHTESDCLRIIEPCVVSDVFAFVSELSLCWQRLAYAGVVVEGDVFLFWLFWWGLFLGILGLLLVCFFVLCEILVFGFRFCLLGLDLVLL